MHCQKILNYFISKYYYKPLAIHIYLLYVLHIVPILFIYSIPFSYLFPEASIGCPIPDLRFSRPKKIGTTTTEQPYVTFETTQIYLPEDFTTADFEYIENVDSESLENIGDNIQRQTRYTDFNPYAWGDGDSSAGLLGPGGDTLATTQKDEHDDAYNAQQHQNLKHERRKLRKNSGRRRLDRHNQGHKQSKREIANYDDAAYNAGDLHQHHHNSHRQHNHRIVRVYDNVYYVQSANIISSLHLSNSIELNQSAQQTTTTTTDAAASSNYNEAHDAHATGNNAVRRTVGDNGNDDTNHEQNVMRNDNNGFVNGKRFNGHTGVDDGITTPTTTTIVEMDNKMPTEVAITANTATTNYQKTGDENSMLDVPLDEPVAIVDVNANDGVNDTADGSSLNRVKRKSGKTTGALSRPKGSSDTGSKSTSRKKEGK